MVLTIELHLTYIYIYLKIKRAHTSLALSHSFKLDAATHLSRRQIVHPMNFFRRVLCRLLIKCSNFERKRPRKKQAKEKCQHYATTTTLS